MMKWLIRSLAVLCAVIASRYCDAQTVCGQQNPFNVDSPRTVTIDRSCTTTTSGSFSVILNPAYVYVVGGDLLTDSCTIYAGESSDPVAGRFTGDGRATGFIAVDVSGSLTNSISYECELTESRPGDFTLVFGQNPNCGATITPSESPIVIESPGGMAGPAMDSTCLWTIQADNPVDFVATFSNIRKAVNSFLFYKASQPAGEVFDFGLASEFISNGETKTVRGSEAQIFFISPPTSSHIALSIERVQIPIPSTCDDTGIQIGLNDAELGTLQATAGDTLYISPSPLLLLSDLDPACVLRFDTTAVFNFNITQCDATVDTSNPNQMVFNYTIWNQKPFDISSAVQRYIRYSVNFACIFNSTAMASSVNIQPRLGEVNTDHDPVSGEFDISLQLFRDDGFSSVLEANDGITVPNNVFAKAELNVGDATNFIVEMDSCWATRTSGSNDEPSYSLVQSGCSAGVATTAEVLRNYQPGYATFKFESFVWTNYSDSDQSMFLHCDVKICQNSTGGCVDPGCSGRKKRSIDPDQYRRLSFGPLHLLQQHNCDKLNGMCSDVCIMVGGEAKCSCFEGRKLTDGGRMCTDAEHIPSIDGAENSDMSSIYSFVFLGGCVLGIGLIFGLVVYSKKPSVYHVL